VLAVGCLGLLGASCLADPQRVQSVQLLDRLTQAQAGLVAQPPSEQACTNVGDVQTRLFGEPGLDVQPAWAALRDASRALQAACGQRLLLVDTTRSTPTSHAERLRLQQGTQRELALACDHLRSAATVLGQPTPC
jgi:hypothetical protein